MWIYGGSANHARPEERVKRSPRSVGGSAGYLCKLWESQRKDISIWREGSEYFLRRPGEWLRLPVTNITEAIRRVHNQQHVPEAGLEEV